VIIPGHTAPFFLSSRDAPILCLWNVVEDRDRVDLEQHKHPDSSGARTTVHELIPLRQTGLSLYTVGPLKMGAKATSINIQYFIMVISATL